MRVLGIDPALQRTGWGVIDISGNSFVLVDAGVVSTSAKSGMSKRLALIHSRISGIILKFDPDIAVLEKVFVHYHHPTTAFLLGEARGIICLACEQGSVPVAEYAATQVKKAMVGQGLASKDQVKRMVCAMLKMKTVPVYSDVTDALALAIAYRFLSKADAVMSLQGYKR